jgi:hypothetical protein
VYGTTGRRDRAETGFKVDTKGAVKEKSTIFISA